MVEKKAREIRSDSEAALARTDAPASTKELWERQVWTKPRTVSVVLGSRPEHKFIQIAIQIETTEGGEKDGEGKTAS